MQRYSKSSAGFLRVVWDEKERPLEVVRVHLEEFDELVKLNQLAGLGRGIRRWSCVGVTGELSYLVICSKI